MSYTMMCAICNVLGIFFANCTSPSMVLAISAIGICIIVINWIIRKKPNLMLLLAFIMLSFGAIAFTFGSHGKLYDAFPDKYVNGRGVIISSTMASSGTYPYKYVVTPESVSYLGNTAKTGQRMYIRTKTPFNYGDIIEFSGFLS